MPNWKKVLTSGSAGELASLFATSITGSLQGTASFAISASRANSALSSSFATTASFAQTASYSQNLQISGSINNVDYIDFDTTNIIGTNAPAWKEGRVFYDSGSGALAVYNWEQDVTLNVGQEQWLRARNQTGVTITNGSVVRLLGALGDRPTVALAQSTDQTNTFSTGNEIIGIATHDIETGTDGFVTTFGLVNGLNTAAYTVGDLLWVSQSAGQFTNVAPPTPFDRTFVGIVTRVNASNGSVFSTPLTPIHFHDISSVSASTYQQGDLWMYRSGSAGQANAWINTKALSGSYDITGSLTVSGSSRVIGTLNADGVQFIRQYNNNGNWFGGSLSVGKSVGATATLDVSGSAIITGSLTVTNGITGSGLQITGSTSTDLVRITQTGAGNAFVVEDTTNPDTTPFVIDALGRVGVGLTNPGAKFVVYDGDAFIWSSGSNNGLRMQNALGTSFWITTPTSSMISIGGNGVTAPSSGVININSSGNMGVGTTTPNAKLDVNGNQIITGSLTVSATGVSGILLDTDTSVGNSERSARLLFGQIDPTKSTSISAISGSMQFGTQATVNSSTGTTRMFISASGDVGIGTNQPTLAKLQVAGNVHATSFTGSLQGAATSAITASYVNPLNQDVIITGSLTVGSGSRTLITSINTGSNTFILNSSANLGLNAGPAAGIAFTVNNGAAAMYITSIGQTLIGNPRVNPIENANATLHVTNVGTQNSFLVEDSANPDTTPFVVDNAGNVGIGTTSPTTLLHVSGSTANLVLIERNLNGNAHIQYKNTSGSMWAGLSPFGNFGIGNQIDLGSSAYLTVISSSGNVGIGTTTPNSKLEVNGNTIITGSLTVTGSINSYDNITLLQNATYLQGKNSSNVTTRILGINSSNLLYIGSVDAAISSIFFNINGSNLLQISSSGDVGLGKSNPTAKLDINGNTIITGSLNVSNSITASAYTTNNALITSTTLTANTGITTIYSIPTASYDGAWFDYTIRSGSNARAGTIFGMWSGSAVNYAETTTTDFGSTSNFTFGMSINGSNMILSSSATTNGWTVNSIIRSI